MRRDASGPDPPLEALGGVPRLIPTRRTEGVIEIRDDGGGIDVARVRATAVERGLLSAWTS